MSIAISSLNLTIFIKIRLYLGLTSLAAISVYKVTHEHGAPVLLKQIFDILIKNICMKYLKLALSSQASRDLVAVDLNPVVGVFLSFMFLKFATLPFSFCSSKLLVSFPPSPWKFRFDLFECFCLASVYFGLRNTISCVMARVLFLR